MPNVCVKPVDYLGFTCGSVQFLSALTNNPKNHNPHNPLKNPQFTHIITTTLSTAFFDKTNLLYKHFSTLYTRLITNTTY